MYRRPLLVLMPKEMFAFGQSEEPRVFVEQPAAVREAYLLGGLLLPHAVTNSGSPINDTIAALDASPGWGAVCEARVSPALATTLWRTGERRGGYSRLETSLRCYRREVGDLLPTDERDCFDPVKDASWYGSPQKELAMYYDAIDIYGGRGRVPTSG
jgi:hypothetical protein